MTTGDFGMQGERLIILELLDRPAADFGGTWLDIKRPVSKSSSSTYRQLRYPQKRLA